MNTILPSTTTNALSQEIEEHILLKEAGDVDGRCPVCNNGNENISHLFRECPSTIMVWAAVIKSDKLNEFYSMSVMEWMRINLSQPSHFMKEGLDWDLLFAAILWNICQRLQIVAANAIISILKPSHLSVVPRIQNFIVEVDCLNVLRFIDGDLARQGTTTIVAHICDLCVRGVWCLNMFDAKVIEWQMR
ncbi:hypothetical protein V6N12_059091 [Hibiscus sabdariffa]|uniref:Reverse transcriptase zinc-binding domain-containing protein n=1 Tax=Hibiscus sabdariffa TaxID=183260 RepID=A0ABR2EW00_9ROSI